MYLHRRLGGCQRDDQGVLIVGYGGRRDRRCGHDRAPQTIELGVQSPFSTPYTPNDAQQRGPYSGGMTVLTRGSRLLRRSAA
jgi:hypothetical protein